MLFRNDMRYPLKRGSIKTNIYILNNFALTYHTSIKKEKQKRILLILMIRIYRHFHIVKI